MTKKPSLICMSAPVAIKAAEGDDSSKPPSFEVVAYTGGAINLGGWDAPLVVDLAGMKFGNSLVANLDHEPSKRVGNVTSKMIDDHQLVLSGTASAATESRREVVESAASGFNWQASIEASADLVTEVAADKTVSVNGQEFTGPLYLASQTTLKGFAFVSHGADDNTTVSIAAKAVTHVWSKTMDPALKTWIEALGFDVDALDESQLAGLTANYKGQVKKETPPTLETGLERVKAENLRQKQITAHAIESCEDVPDWAIENIELLAKQAIEEKWDYDKFRSEVFMAQLPTGGNVKKSSVSDRGMSESVLAAAVCEHGRLENIDEHFDDRTLQAAHDRFPRGIGLNQLIMLGAQANGHNSGYASQVDIHAQRAAFGMSAPQTIKASGFSTLSIANVVAATANKFLHEGWNHIDLTPLSIASIRSVNNFQTITTVSLTGDLTFEKVGPDGEIKHGDLGDLTYTNKADTYARMLGITRTDIINDDLSALTSVPRKLGRGAGLKLNDIFWTEFLNNSAFFASGNANVSTDTGALGSLGLSQAETIFLSQTDPDGNPLGAMPTILLVPTALKTTAAELMDSDKTKGDTDAPDANVWKGRFSVYSSPYMHNTGYTGYSAVAWYMLADPNDMPVIEIAALNGRVEPVVESADADFNVLGIQLRGYSDIGVNLQEYRGGVRADGSAAG
jgi:hypothetical protein